jgi:hypothetical protein
VPSALTYQKPQRPLGLQWDYFTFYVLFVCKCTATPGDNPIAVNKYIVSYDISYTIEGNNPIAANTRKYIISYRISYHIRSKETTQLQLINISYRIISYIMIYDTRSKETTQLQLINISCYHHIIIIYDRSKQPNCISYHIVPYDRRKQLNCISYIIYDRRKQPNCS